MAMVVKNNMSAVNTLNTLNKNQSLLGKSLQKVSSGMKINSAQDDASGYAISERMRVMLRSLDQANQNTQNGSSLMKVAEGSVSNTVEILKTLKEKAINAATDTNTDEDRAIIQKEIDQLVDQIDDNALITFNGKYLLDGSKSAAGDATYNTWTNQSLSEGTTATTKLTELKARDGEPLTIETSDKVTVSYVQNGKTYTTTASILDDKGNVRSLVDVFKLAEDIDTDTQTFAVSSNEAVQAAGGTDQLSTAKEVISEAIKNLRDQLSYRNQTGFLVLGTDADSSGSIDAAVEYFGQEGGVNNTYIMISGEGTGAQIVSADAGATAESNQNTTLEPLVGKYTLGMESTYNGSLTTNVTEALGAYRTASSSVESYQDAFTSALSTYNQSVGEANRYTWSATAENSIDDAKSIAYATGNNDVISAYNNLKNAIDKKTDAYTTLKQNVNSYNEGLAQLDTLLALQDLENAKTSYLKKVDTYISDIEDIMNTASRGTTFTLPAGLAGNNGPLEYKAGTTSTDVITEISGYLRNKLESLIDNFSLIGENGIAFATAVNSVIGGATSTAAYDGNFTADDSIEITDFSTIFNKDGTAVVGNPLTVYGSLSDEAVDVVNALKPLGDAETAAKAAGVSSSVIDAVKAAVVADVQVSKDDPKESVSTAPSQPTFADASAAVDDDPDTADVDETAPAKTAKENTSAAIDAAINKITGTEAADTFQKAILTALKTAVNAQDTLTSDSYDAIWNALATASTGLIDTAKAYYNAVEAYNPSADTTSAGALLVDLKSALISSANYNEKLKLVYDGALDELSGPALLTGSNVGVDPAGKVVTTLDGTAGITFMAANSGADGQISGFTISISDSDGNVRKSVNTSLNAWSTSVYGKNASAKDNSLAFQIGASANQTITVDMADMRAEALGLKGKDGKVVDVSTKENANAAISVFENALQKALDVQTTVGAIEARLEYTSSNLTTSSENVQAAESTIRDADMAKEMTNYTKNNVLLQAAQSMLAQANQNSSAVLSLLQ